MSRTGRLAAATAVLAVVIAAGTATLLRSRTAPEEVAETPSPAVTATPTPSPRTTSVEQQLHAVARLVAEVRELDFEELPEPTYLSPDELAGRAALLLEGYTEAEAAQDARILAALGAIPADMDLRETLGEALAEQVAGIYDPRTGELVVATSARDGPLPPFDEITLAHELQHALADQVLGLPDEDPEPGTEDAALAAQALVEGDATYAMILYAQRALTPGELADLAAQAGELAGQQEVLEALPHYLRRSLVFPYEEGLTFVVSVESRAGWEAVNDAYRKPPTSTLQILRPELFLSGEGGGEETRDVSDPGAPWRREARLQFGAADLLFLFEAPGDDPSRALEDASTLAATWRGGELILLTDGDRTAVGIAMVGTSRLCDGMDRWYAAAFPTSARSTRDGVTRFDGTDQDAVLRCDGSDVRLGIAPDLGRADAITR
ncbi:MAG: hypothetical protein ACRDUY_07120 [Nitriliruptorales bacterium]